MARPPRSRGSYCGCFAPTEIKMVMGYSYIYTYLGIYIYIYMSSQSLVRLLICTGRQSLVRPGTYSHESGVTTTPPFYTQPLQCTHLGGLRIRSQALVNSLLGTASACSSPVESSLMVYVSSPRCSTTVYGPFRPLSPVGWYHTLSSFWKYEMDGN
ncbi:hypothetical protein GGR52DRAFT_91697 [Hypoxylon sp. FL1284]|nr:hypothetical protein GGR52DRAFT_91697 [Hypoxylon sp. FL1284]